MKNLEFIAEMLPPEFLEEGEARKFIVDGLSGDFKVEILQVKPHTVIATHQHKEDWEIQINLTTGKFIGICGVGESHNLANNTDEPWEILCLKGKSGVGITFD